MNAVHCGGLFMRQRQRRAWHDQAFLHHIKDVTFQPIFIMGDHRSGTTLLYQLLQRTQRFNVVQAYHIIDFEQLLADHVEGREAERKDWILQQLRQAGMRDRALDQVEVGPELPEEYGFVLDDSRRPRLTPANLARLLQLCCKIQVVSEEQRPVVLKNPWDFTNFLYIAQALPEAKFIFLHRHPVDVINSQIDAARTLYEAKSTYHALLDRGYERIWQRPVQLAAVRLLFSSYFGIGRRITVRHVRRSIEYYNRNVDTLPRHCYTEIRFEDLLHNTTATIGQVMSFLGMENTHTNDLQKFIRSRAPHQLPEIERRRSSIVDQFSLYCEKWGYTSNTK